MAQFPGPRPLGRGLVVAGDASLPAEAAGWHRFVVGEAALTDAGAHRLADELHHYWLRREPVVIELHVDPAALREPERCDVAPYELGPDHDFARGRLQYLVWSNNFDGRSDPAAPIWWHGRRAERLGAAPGFEGDVRLPGGGEVWCDGGPRGPVPGGTGIEILHRETIEAGSLRPDRSPAVTADLASDQLAAVGHGSGPARIIAPAGSGKTRVLTERLRHLLADRHVSPGSVLAVAFNKRAADELVERTAGLPAHVRTLNSLGLAIVNGTPPFAPTGASQRRLVQEREVRAILQSRVKLPRQVNTDPWQPYLEALSAIRLGLREPDEVEEAIPDAAGVAELFGPYRELLMERRLLDFDEQIYLAIETLLTRPDVRRHAQALARHLLVDEFQDLTPAHLLLIRLLAAPSYDVFGVGDDDQVIYSYAGATPAYLIDYERYFPGAAEYALETNYRCPPAIVGAARTLLAHNRRRVPKSIHAACERPDAEPPADERSRGQRLGGDGSARQRLRVEQLPPGEHAGSSLKELRRWASDGAAWSDMAVLARVNSALLPVQITLLESGVPCSLPLGSDVLDRTGIRAALAYLRIGVDPERISRSDVSETIRRPSRRIARNVTEMLTRRGTTSAREIRRLARALSGGDVAKLQSYADDLELVARSVASGSTAAALRTIRTTIGLGTAMDDLDSARSAPDRSTHHDDLAALEQVARLHEDPASFELWLRQRLEAPQPADRSLEAPGGAVTLSTVHRVKGREWPHVVLFAASDDLFPHRLALDVEEERRIFHVAITRCRDDVVVLADAEHPSRFCAELSTAPAPGSAGPEAPARPGSSPFTGRLATAGGQLSPGRGNRRTRSLVGRDGPGGGRLSEALREWRRSAAAAAEVPAYVVLSDAHLEGIAAARPVTLAELARCRGIGPAKLERYGDEILRIVESVSSTPAPR